MNRDKEYYQRLLHQLEYTQLDYVGELLQIELAVYEIRKLLQEMREIGEYDNPILDSLKLDLGQLRKKHEILTHELNDLELDISHVKFMIDILSRAKDDE
ncbi:hypothetical protein GCM10028805_08790 [Spirosoma harenae]